MSGLNHAHVVFSLSLSFFLIRRQAQDRAYRIGQDKNVKVFRLVSQGTVEELKYLRQVYKTHLKNETMIDVGDRDRDESARLFKGVAGNKYCKGELFGLENLLKFKDGTFLEYTSDRPKETKQYGIEVHQMKDMLEKVEQTSEDVLAAIGDKENAYLDLSRWTEKSKCFDTCSIASSFIKLT